MKLNCFLLPKANALIGSLYMLFVNLVVDQSIQSNALYAIGVADAISESAIIFFGIHFGNIEEYHHYVYLNAFSCQKLMP